MDEEKISPPTSEPSDKTTKKRKTYLTAAVVVLVLASYLAGVSSADTVNLEKLGIRVLNQQPPAGVTDVDYGYLWKALEVVNSQYVEKPLDQKKLMYGAVEGLLRALGDPHSTFLDPEENKNFLADLEGNFEGIGAEISIKNDTLTVVAPLPNAPAEKAGILPGDVILKIDNQDTFNLSLEEAVTKIRGPKGTTVVLTVLHKDAEKTEDISITRESIHIESVTSEIRTVRGKRIGIIEVRRFSHDTKPIFNQTISRLGNVSALIIDLRNNPGGLLDSAIDLSSMWLSGEQIVLKEVNAEKQEFLYYSEGPGTLAKTRTIVLINEGSASASEILTGALQDHKLATVVGEKSFGKGSVQDLVDAGGGASIKITIAKWLTPNGRSIDNQGLEPDVKVEMGLEDYQADRDPQLDKALELAAQ